MYNSGFSRKKSWNEVPSSGSKYGTGQTNDFREKILCCISFPFAKEWPNSAVYQVTATLWLFWDPGTKCQEQLHVLSSPKMPSLENYCLMMFPVFTVPSSRKRIRGFLTWQVFLQPSLLFVSKRGLRFSQLHSFSECESFSLFRPC